MKRNQKKHKILKENIPIKKLKKYLMKTPKMRDTDSLAELKTGGNSKLMTASLHAHY